LKSHKCDDTLREALPTGQPPRSAE